ncbi:hypothetical protein HKD37_11G030247 [Glycine soja]
MHNLGLVVFVKLWAILLGIQIAWSRGFTQLLTHIYVAILLMSQGCTTYHPCSYLVRSIKAFEEQGGQFVWLHSLRETNQAADKLTKFGLDLGRELRIFEFVTQFFYRMLFLHR